MNFNNNQIQKILNIYKGIYVFIIVLSSITLILAILLNSISPINRIPETIILMLVPVIVSIYLYYGIKHKKTMASSRNGLRSSNYFNWTPAIRIISNKV